jgi:hypothetical protein
VRPAQIRRPKHPTPETQICVPEKPDNEERPAAQIGGYLRIAADQRWLQTVIRFQAGQRETLTLRQR